MLKQYYHFDENPYGINNFRKPGHGDFMASFGCAIITDGNIFPDDGGSTDPSNIVIADKNNYYEVDDLESVLQEIGGELDKSVVDIHFTDEEELAFTLSNGKQINLGSVPATIEGQIISGGGAPIDN